MSASSPESLATIYFPLRMTYGLVPVVAGVDKFFNLLTDWGAYLPDALTGILPGQAHTLMMIVGCIEIAAGLAVLTKFARLGAHVVMAWLMMIAATLIVSGHLDIAVRDLVMAVGAYTLGQVAALRHEPWLPFAHAPRPAEVNVHVR
jgi:hypothetical protein